MGGLSLDLPLLRAQGSSFGVEVGKGRATLPRYAPSEGRPSRRVALDSTPRRTLINQSGRTDRATGGHDDTYRGVWYGTTLPQCPSTIRRGPIALRSTCAPALLTRQRVTRRRASLSDGTSRYRSGEAPCGRRQSA